MVRRHVRNLQCFQQEVREIEVELRKMTNNDTLIKLLLEQRGIGLITACKLRAEVGIFGRFGTGKQLSKFCGLSPRNASSGQKQADAGLIKAANPLLKTAIIEGAHGLIRWDDTHRAFASRLYKQGKPVSVVIAAVTN